MLLCESSTHTDASMNLYSRQNSKEIAVDTDIQAKLYRTCNRKDIAIQGGPGSGPLCRLWFTPVSEGLKKGEGAHHNPPSLAESTGEC